MNDNWVLPAKLVTVNVTVCQNCKMGKTVRRDRGLEKEAGGT